MSLPVGSTIVTHVDQHWLYYSGANERRGIQQIRYERKHAIGLTTLRLDGLVGLNAGENEGVVVTKNDQARSRQAASQYPRLRVGRKCRQVNSHLPHALLSQNRQLRGAHTVCGQ